MLFDFGNNLGWYSFLVLIPFIIFYLIKPKPTKLKVPSLIFFMKNTSSSKIKSLFRYFQRDLLFLIQLLIFLLLAFSITQPILFLNRDVVSGNVIFVLDISASSKVLEAGNETRLEIGKDKLKDLISSKNSLILAKSSPILALEDVRAGTLNSYINRLESTDDTTDLSSAMALAAEILNNKKGRVVVISDFAYSKGVNPVVAKNLLESKGIPVDFINTRGENLKNNVGFVDMILRGDEVNLYLKNYNSFDKKVDVKFGGDTTSFNLKSGSVEPIVFKLVDNLTKAEILDKDDFMVDNDLLIYRPYNDKIKVLLISNNPSKYLKAVLNSIDGVVLTVAEPPIIPNEDFDVYIFDGVDVNKLVVDNYGSVMRKVRDEGKNAIIIGQNNINKIDFEGLIPIKFKELINSGTLSVDYNNKYNKDIDFGNVKRIFSFDGEGVNIVSYNGTGVITLFNLGKGKVVYYGILDTESDFKITLGYPIFWNGLIYSLVGRGDLNEVNLKTGSLIELGNESKVLDRKGIYKISDKTVVVNLLNQIESDVNVNFTSKDVKFVNDGKLEKSKSKVDHDLEIYLAALVLMLLLFEFFYIKFRGEI